MARMRANREAEPLAGPGPAEVAELGAVCKAGPDKSEEKAMRRVLLQPYACNGGPESSGGQAAPPAALSLYWRATGATAPADTTPARLRIVEQLSLIHI
eukprot:2561983-Alexandrium_andersonii.AAC.1